MKNYHLLFWLAMLTMVAMSIVTQSPIQWHVTLCQALMLGGAVLVMAPFPDESGVLSLIMSVSAITLSAVSSLFILIDSSMWYVCFVVQAAIITLFLHAGCHSHGGAPINLERKCQSLYRDRMRSLLTSAVYLEYILLLAVMIGPAPPSMTRVLVYLISVYAAAIDAQMYYRLSRGSVMTETITLATDKDSAAMRQDEDARLKEIFRRVDDYMTEKTPYLDDALTIDKVAKDVFTNKSYVSRSIKQVSKKNFCQYINELRVLYSMKLLELDPGMKLKDAASQSGFHSQSTYNSSFRALNAMTPTEWLQKKQVESLHQTPFHEDGTGATR